MSLSRRDRLTGGGQALWAALKDRDALIPAEHRRAFVTAAVTAGMLVTALFVGTVGMLVLASMYASK